MRRTILRRFMFLIVAVLLAVLPTTVVRSLARAVGHHIAPSARVGFSLVLSRRIYLDAESRIGHLNFIRNGRLLLRERAYIGNLNVIRGPVDISLAMRAAIGNRNQVARAPHGVTYGPAVLRLGELSKVTANHFIDCTVSVTFGDFSTLAGKGSQVWTHGYVHSAKGAGRYRVDGRVMIGHNVYIGAGTIITGGVVIADHIIVGVGTTVSKSLSEPGMYVSAALRFVPRPMSPDERTDMKAVVATGLVETVYRKVDPRA